jgi:site-specific recombinase XerD
MDANIELWHYEWTQQGRSEKTFGNMRRDLARFVDWLGKDPGEATRVDCLTYLNETTQRSAHAAEHAWRALRSFYAFLSDEDGTASPMERIKCPRRPEPHVKGVSEAEYHALLSVCGRHHRDRAIITLLMETGLRRTELANLRLSDVDLDLNVIVVRKSKTGKPRLVPMSNDARLAMLRYLRVRKGDSDVLWFGRKGPLSSDGVRLMLVRRSHEAGVKVSAHQFRRSFAVGWLVDGGSQVSLQHICGWSSPAMPARYTRHAGERLAAAEMKRLRG